MTERLTTLLHREAEAIPVPVADVHAVLGRARRLGRRRRTTEALAVLGVCGALVAGTLLAFGPDRDSAAQRQYAASAPADAYSRYGAFAVGSTVYVGNHHVSFDEKIKALYYTSEGVLVRGGKVAVTDATGPSRYTLVRPDGTTRVIDLKMGDRVTGTDPDSPNVAYAEPTGDHWSLVVVSLVTGKEIARTQVRGAFTWGGWEAPPVDLYGDTMWALFDRGWVEYNWRTGAIRTVPGTRGSTLESAHGLYAQKQQPLWVIKDFATGRTVRTVRPTDADLGGTLSPDGRYGRIYDDYISSDGVPPSTEVRFLTVSDGHIVTLPGDRLYGWTPDGHTLSVDVAKDRITVCDAGTGACEDLDVDIVGSGAAKLGGLSYES